MRNILFLVSSIMFFIGCATDLPIHKIPPKTTHVKEEIKTTQKISKDDHRYDTRYQNFNYDRLGYNNNAGSYYGYYDQRGYFYDNRYYHYNNQYTYDDRYNRRGFFGSDGRHNREQMNNPWNQSHTNYIEPVTRVYHPREGTIGYGDLSYQNSDENVQNRQNSRAY
jgi:hypothetical protein